MNNKWIINKYLVGAFFCLLFPIVFVKLYMGKLCLFRHEDTITILGWTNTQTLERLFGIDRPENGQDVPNVAKRLTSELYFSKALTV